MNYHLRVKDFWNKKNTVEEFYSQPISGYWLDFFSLIKNRSNKKILDLGCGGGRNTEMLINLGFDVYACDLYEGMVRATKNRLKEMGLKKWFIEDRIVEAPMTNLPYDSSFFNIVLSHGVYHNAQNIEDFSRAFKESTRVLKIDGRLCINMFTSNFIAKNFKRINGQENLYVTQKKLPMVLLSRDEILRIADNFNLRPIGRIIEYQTVVSTGERSVLRGIFLKKF